MDHDKFSAVKQPVILIKYGGNAMTDNTTRLKLLTEISELNKAGIKIVIVHGGGPFISEALNNAGIESKFIQGQRVTTSQAIIYVEMALKGRVNGELVTLLNQFGARAVGLSGKDGQLVTASQKQIVENGRIADLGLVGDIDSIDTNLINILLENDYLPVIAPLGYNEGLTYNINADVFASRLAAELKVSHFILLTDVDGLYKDRHDPKSIIDEITTKNKDSIQQYVDGGMIPKLDSVLYAVRSGVKECVILNGNKPGFISRYLDGEKLGTKVIWN
jgi:acetylglutamate kinase